MSTLAVRILLVVALAGSLQHFVHGSVAHRQMGGPDRALLQTTACPSNTPNTCSNSCVNLLTDGANCGSCGNQCGANQHCEAGTCTCNAFYGSCGGSPCDTLLTTSKNCGRCGNTCNSASECNANAGSCQEVECFPGHALVQLPGGLTRRMDQLALGDSVAVRRPDGSVGYEPIYGWGHREAGVKSLFVRADLVPVDGAGATPLQLEMTPGHFAMTTLPSGVVVPKRASDVVPGDRMLVAPYKCADGNRTEQLQQWVVAAVRLVELQGIYSPYTLGGNLLVNGALASSHSMWYADALFDTLGLPASWLPGLYQATLAPARTLWHLLGRERYVALHAAVDARLNIGNTCSKDGLMGFLRVFATAVTIVASDAATAAWFLAKDCVGAVSEVLLGGWTSAAAVGALGLLLAAGSKSRCLKQA